jgi:hypothetical protein
MAKTKIRETCHDSLQKCHVRLDVTVYTQVRLTVVVTFYSIVRVDFDVEITPCPHLDQNVESTCLNLLVEHQ